MDDLTLNKLEKEILDLYEDGKPFRYQMEYRKKGSIRNGTLEALIIRGTLLISIICPKKI